MAKETFNPEPIDGDGDGIVQEGTKFERPATPKGWTVALDGDNYLTIAERLDAKDPLKKANELAELNNSKPIYPGLLVKIDDNA